MTKPAVAYPDIERLVVDHLTPLLDPSGVTVGVGLPDGWTTTSPTHLQVACDGTPTGTHPVVVWATVRLVAWAATPTAAKEIAAEAQGHLLAHPGGAPVAGARYLTGVQPDRDPDHQAELAAVTCRVGVRSTPIT